MAYGIEVLGEPAQKKFSEKLEDLAQQGFKLFIINMLTNLRSQSCLIISSINDIKMYTYKGSLPIRKTVKKRTMSVRGAGGGAYPKSFILA